MKPKNFPGRKNRRRKTVIKQLLKKEILSHQEIMVLEKTKAKIMPDEMALSKKTKKHRTK